MDKLTRKKDESHYRESVSLTRKQLEEKANRSRGFVRSKIKCLLEQNLISYEVIRANGGETNKYFISHDILKEHFNIILNDVKTDIITTTNTPLLYQKKSFLPDEDNSHLNELSGKDLKIALAKTELVLKLIDNSFGNTKKKKEDVDIIKSYNLNLPGFEHIYSILGCVSLKTVYRWRKIYLDANRDYRSLAPQYPKSKKDFIPENQKVSLLKAYCQPNKPLKSEVARLCRKKFIEQGHTQILTEKTYLNFLNRYISENFDFVTFYRDGDKAFTDTVLPPFKRNRESVEVGDIIVGDGHVLNFRIIDPYNGKLKRMQFVAFQDFRSRALLGYEISPAENTEAIRTALFRSILILGKIPKVVYLDNGKAFNAKIFTDYRGIFERLLIKLMNAAPYKGQSKIIERFFRTFSELARQISSFVGTSIKDKPAHLLRGEKVHSKIYEKLNYPIVDYYAAHNAIANWLDDFHSRPTKALNGKTPQEIFEAGRGPGVNKLDLMFLMMTEENKMIKRGQIKLLGEEYVSNHFYGIEKYITVRYDLLDLKFSGTVYCFDSKTGAFICTATRKNLLHPAAGILGTDEDVRLLEKELKNRSMLKAHTTKSAKEFLEKEVIPTVKKQIAVANNEREKLEAEEMKMKKTGTDDVEIPLDWLKSDNSRSREENKPRTWID